VPGQKNHLDSIQTAKQQLVGSLPPWGFHFAPFHVFQSVDFVDAASAKDTERRCRMQVAHFFIFWKVLKKQLNFLRWRKWIKPFNDTGFAEEYERKLWRFASKRDVRGFSQDFL
jgi:hypothetical protein